MSLLLQQSLSTFTEFVTLFATAIDRCCFQRPRNYALCKPPESSVTAFLFLAPSPFYVIIKVSLHSSSLTLFSHVLNSLTNLDPHFGHEFRYFFMKFHPSPLFLKHPDFLVVLISLSFSFTTYSFIIPVHPDGGVLAVVIPFLLLYQDVRSCD